MKLLGCLCAAMLSDADMKNILKKVFTVIICFSILCVTGCSKEKSATLISNANLSSSKYVLGDSMGDYLVTDWHDYDYKFSQVLKDKKAIVLNFWFINCVPCQMEFPYLQKAYEQYEDDIEVIAINPVDSNFNDILKYVQKNELMLPVAQGEEAWISAFDLQGFPTTVVIDRYGKVAFMHTGAITEEGVFEKIFEFFSNDSYKQSIIRNISDIQ